MKAITICQPYAHLIEIGDKPIENRTWWSSHRGELAIHAGKSREWMDDAETYGLSEKGLTFGAIVAVVDMAAALAIAATWPDRFRHLQNHEHANGPYCHVYENVRRLRDPIQCRGAQGLWDLPVDVERKVRAASFV